MRSLREASMEEQFRKSLVSDLMCTCHILPPRVGCTEFSLLNLPEHAGVQTLGDSHSCGPNAFRGSKVLPLQEVLEDSQFYYIVMEQAPPICVFMHRPPKSNFLSRQLEVPSLAAC